jgi:dephospho-CoA kinase
MEVSMVIGLTGGIATGKSTVSAMLAEHGATIIDSDRIARQVVQPGTPGLAKIVAHFGEEYLLPGGELNRTKLGQRIFSDEKARQRLMEITHPYIFAEINTQIEHAQSQGEKMIVLDAPLLIETGLNRQVERVVLVYVDEETQIERLMKRDHLTREEAMRRIASQMSIEEKKRYADIIIDNRGSLKELEDQVERLFIKYQTGEL